jgi:hypothetical protein
VKLNFGYIGDGIVAALRERPAPQQALHREPDSTPRAVSRDRFLRIHRARWIKLAGSAKQRRKKNPVKTDAKQRRTPR